MIITIGMEKGGDGKTTIATNIVAMLASKGKDVLLVDSDKQGSAFLWNVIRNDNTELAQVTCFQKFGRIREDVYKVSDKFDYIVIDTPGRKSLELQSALLVSDILILPLSVGFFDAWALSTMNDMVDTALSVNPDLVVKTLVNRASTNATVDDLKEAAAVLKNFPLLESLFSTVIHERRIYRYASGAGKSVIEMPKPDKAGQEMLRLFKELFPNEV